LQEKEFHKKITDVPIFDCIVCEQTFFLKDVTSIKQEHKKVLCNQKKKKIRTNCNRHTNNSYICKLCKKALENDVDAKFVVPKKIRRNKSIRILKKLDELEERLIAL
jgi:hypothetical protein